MKITNIKDKLITLGMVAAVVLAMYFLKIRCPFKALFSIPCPGCGITRAYLSLLHLDLKAAFNYNPMFWSVPLLLVIYLFDGKIFPKKWLNGALLIAILAGFFICWGIRLF